MANQSFLLQKLSNNAPKFLYHYTNSKGLLGILDSGKIWTTKIQYLNDKSELNLALKYINEEIENQLRGDEKTRTDEDLTDMKGIIETLTNQNINVSVASFTGQGDQLSQWRGYCNIGTGYSLGFDSQRLLAKLIENRAYHLVECEYLEENHKRMVKELVDSTSVVSIRQNPNYGKPPFYDWNFAQSILFLAPIIKSEKFKEEQEWRLISSPLSLEYKDAEFRSGNYSLIPYWKCDIDIMSTLSSIIIGPTPEPELSKQALQGLLYQKGFNFVYKIENSKIPYGQI